MVDFIETGSGRLVLLLHSSVAGVRQWKALMSDHGDQFHFRAPHLIGYGANPVWSGPASQSLADQAHLMAEAIPDEAETVSIVGHSFGGSVAMKLAQMLGVRVDRLVLIEPNPFYLLHAKRPEAFEEALGLRSIIKAAHDDASWLEAAARFADYWNGSGSWDATPDDRRQKFAAALRPNFHEWDAVMNEDTPLDDWVSSLPRTTKFLMAKNTVRTIREIGKIFQSAAPYWAFQTLEKGGHMAPLSRPDLVNPLIIDALG